MYMAFAHQGDLPPCDDKPPRVLGIQHATSPAEQSSLYCRRFVEPFRDE